jgi:hypothetical protein
MTGDGTIPNPRRRRTAAAPALIVLAGLLVAACSAAAAPTPTATPAATAAPTATPTPSPTPLPTKGPATQTLGLMGSAAGALAVTNASIRCGVPSASGLQIQVLGQPSDPNTSVYVFVWAGNVTVRYDSGSGSTYKERDFAGTGVTAFDAATGAKIDSPLTETADGTAHGTLGVLTSIKGSVDCGNQTPGTSTLALSGVTPKGALSGGLDPVNVQCVNSPSIGSYVSIIGIGMVGSTSTEVILAIYPGKFTVYPVLAGFYTSATSATATLSATGAQIDGDAVEQLAKAVTTAPHTVHVTGNVVCGTTVAG